VKERGIGPADVGELLTTQPDWLVAEQQRRQAQIEREATDKLRRELTDTLIASVHEVWFQELKRATTDSEVDAIDARWAATRVTSADHGLPRRPAGREGMW
jgi:hypothetical protein